MSTLCYRDRAARGVCQIFSVQALLSCPVASWCTRNDDNDMLPRPHGGGCSSPFSVEALLCCPFVSCCTRNDDNEFLPRTRDGGFSYPFFVETLPCCPVASWCTRNDGNDILPQALSGGCSSFFPSRQYSGVRLRLVARRMITTTSYRIRVAVGVRPFFFPSRHYSAVRSRLGVRGTIITTSYRSRSVEGVRQFFSSRHNSTVRSRLGARGTMTTLYFRVRAAVGVRHLFSIEALLCCPIVSCCTRNDDNDILPRTRDGGCSSPFPSRHYSAVRSCLVARGTMTTTSYRGRATVGVRHLLRRGTTLLSGHVLVHAGR
ncbi:hypothetical protein TNCV_1573661 [Trichonephila clavipes]|nr:hypothetical protein TNCV_1573661 [Trichonephila clavipes]